VKFTQEQFTALYDNWLKFAVWLAKDRGYTGSRGYNEIAEEALGMAHDQIVLPLLMDEDKIGVKDLQHLENLMKRSIGWAIYKVVRGKFKKARMDADVAMAHGMEVEGMSYHFVEVPYEKPLPATIPEGQAGQIIRLYKAGLRQKHIVKELSRGRDKPISKQYVSNTVREWKRKG